MGTESQTFVKPRKNTKYLIGPFLWLIFTIVFMLSLNVQEWITKELYFLLKQFNYILLSCITNFVKTLF